jgi:hypothetical protein
MVADLLYMLYLRFFASKCENTKEGENTTHKTETFYTVWSKWIRNKVWYIIAKVLINKKDAGSTCSQWNQTHKMVKNIKF